MDFTQSRKPPTHSHNRLILQFDYDCFYAQVHTILNPSLAPPGTPLGIKQKNILATCNYAARARGVRKLMLVTEASRLCPELRLVDGEDLTPFRDISKKLFGFVRGFSWCGRVERLGLDEIFMDVTDLVDHNISCLNRNGLESSFFYLSKQDPEKGFPCDLTTFAGMVEGEVPDKPNYDDVRFLRLLLGSHLALYLRTRIEDDYGYTSTCGVSTNKVLSKLVGARHKPRNQTTLLALTDDDVTNFMDDLKLRSVPGIGFKMASILESHLTGHSPPENSHECESKLKVGQVRKSPKISPASLEKMLSGPGAERGAGSRIWQLLHGVDPSEVKEASDVPSQISIEDTYKGLSTMPQIIEELHKLSHSLLRRMKIDLLTRGDGALADAGEQRWLARPRTLRLSIRSWHNMHAQNYQRASRSGPLPNFVFDLQSDMEHLAERLVSEALLPLLRRLSSEKGPKWNLQLINICAANMVMGAAEDRPGVGRNIASMFKHQDEALRPWRVMQDGSDVDDEETGERNSPPQVQDPEETPASDTEGGWEESDNDSCPQCGHAIPAFALAAHLRYHDLEE
ncbi:uncharacterized protein F5Z01DRAFT_384809 [Emericellopsis atlantica]|uniref:UmuC domain-containing protein n=1 Tax=Emericellopsis atlantica TaxID=2614577 RepID=A0A9P7ZT91_9HYPO|nr:uncharacterized protein F5Z01DRAFT_384809 [Emericellopsis atlantica]KAG9257392.1 hypothetical protein F5Z01DRAFT_384809 [Emericellopsis atlantica]